MATDDPPRNLIPAFSKAPPSQPATEDPDPTPGSPTPPRRLYPDGAAGPVESDSPRPDRASRTGISSVGEKPTVADTTALVAGLIGVVALLAGVAVRATRKARLRKPTNAQADEIAAPLARIALRHLDVSWLNKDLADAIKAGGAVGRYLEDGPLLEYGPTTDPGIPDNLQEAQP